MLKVPDVSLLKAHGVPLSVIEVILKATTVKPADRYQSAEEMLHTLRELLRDDNRLFYIGENTAAVYDVATQSEVWHVPVDLGSGLSALAVSGDGGTAALLLYGQVLLYHTENGQSFPFSLGSSETFETKAPIENPLLALNEDGSILAASLPDGSARLYRLGGGEGAEIHPANPTNSSLRFEGGFYGGDFFYSAAERDRAGTRFTGGVYHLDEFDWENPPEVPDVVLSEYQEIHVQAGGDGIYASVGGSIQYYDPEAEDWTGLALEDTDIKVLRHGGGRLLALTETGGLVLVYREDGAWRTEAAREASFNLAGISETRLFPANTDRPRLSLMDWREPDAENALLSYVPRG